MENANSFANLSKRWGNKALEFGGKAVNWAKDNPGKTAGIAALTAGALSSGSDNALTKLVTPLLTAGATYALLKGLPALSNVGGIVNNTKSLIGNANYATLEARALMEKGNHLADTIPGAPLIFGRKKAMKKIQMDANRRADKVFLDAYRDYVNKGAIAPLANIRGIDDIKNALRQAMG